MAHNDTVITGERSVSASKIMSSSESLYMERENKRRLNSFPAYNSLNLGAGASLIIFLLIMFNAFDAKTGTINSVILIVALLYLLPAALAFFIGLKVKSEILQSGEIKNSTRLLGLSLLPFMLLFNVFVAIAGFSLAKKYKPVEYMLCAWSVLTSVSVMVISSLNLFKPFVADNFSMGMAFLAVLSVFYIFAMFLVNRYVKEKTVDKKMLPAAIVLIISAATGNLFALLAGIIIITKIRSQGKSIEWIDIVRRLFRNNMSMLGLFVVIFLLSVSICSYLTFDYLLAIENNYQAMLKPPSLMYPFGTDEFGRCVFTRIIFGASISLIVGIISTIIPIIVGGLLGAVAGYYGSRPDNIIMRILDILYAVPGILLAIAIVAAFGANTTNLIIALSIGSVPMYARTMRASVMSVSHNEFVEAATACGQRSYLVVLKHIIPNSMAPIIVRATLGIGSAVLSTSALSFLGLGVEPHIPEWGNVLKVGSKYLEMHPHLAIYPGLAIVLIVLAFNYFGDGLRDALDPKLK